jgi:hypothetical protein
VEQKRKTLTVIRYFVMLVILCRTCLLKHVVGGKIEKKIDVIGWRGGRSKQLLHDFKEQRGYWELEDKTTSLSAKKSFGKVLGICFKTLRFECWSDHWTYTSRAQARPEYKKNKCEFFGEQRGNWTFFWPSIRFLSVGINPSMLRTH